MNKIDDILDRLQNQPQPTVDLPDELTDSIMSALPDREAMEPKPRRRYGLYAISAISVAAGIALLLVFRFGNAAEEPRQAHKAQPTVIHTATAIDSSAPSQASLSVSKADASPRVGEGAVKSAPSGRVRAAFTAKAKGATLPDASLAEVRPAPGPHRALGGFPAQSADSTAILTARIEAEMQQISDDCYMERLSRTINNDPQLRRMVDDFINETTEEAHSAVYVKQL